MRYPVTCHTGSASTYNSFYSRRTIVPSGNVIYKAFVTVLRQAEIEEETFVTAFFANLELQCKLVAIEAIDNVFRRFSQRCLLQQTVIQTPFAFFLHRLVKIKINGRSICSGQFHILEFNLCMPRAEAETSFIIIGYPWSAHSHITLHIVRRTVFSRHLLYIIRTASKYLVRIQPNEVDSPRTVVPVLQKRGIRSHLHQVAVALHTGDKGGFREGGTHVSTAYIGVTSIFTYIDIVFSTRMVIKDSRVLEEEFRIHVPVRVDHIRFGNLTRSTQTVIGNQDQLGIFRFDSCIEDIETLVILIAPVLITNLYVLQRERFGMALFGTLGTPFGSHVTDSILDGIHAIVQIVIYLTLR